MAGTSDDGARVAMEFAETLIGTFEFAAARFVDRLVGLGDDEYFFEPVAGCWSVRETEPGHWTIDGVAGAQDPAPVTTIAWRMTHLAGHVLGGFATWLCDGGSPYGGDVDVPHAASAAVSLLERNWSRWLAGMRALDVEGWRAPLGPQFGPYADESTHSLALHVFDEFVHHAAEVAVLRDLYAHRADV